MDPQGTTRTYVLKPAAMAGIAAAGAAFLHPGARVLVGSQNVAFPVFIAGATFVAAEACALINDYLFSHIPVISAFEAPAHTALNIGTQLGVVAGIEHFLAPGLAGQDTPIAEMAAFAAATEVGSSYLVDEIIIPMYNRWQN
jgi:hypothetical protein